jgi:hypothetical protein
VVVTINDLLQGTYSIAASHVRDVTGVPVSADDDSAAFYVPSSDISNWTDLGHMVVYPNPIMPNSLHAGRVVFGNLPPATSIRIYNHSGQLVRSLDESEQGRGRKLWYLDNDQHQDVASGIYVYIAKCAGDRRTGKLAVVR